MKNVLSVKLAALLIACIIAVCSAQVLAQSCGPGSVSITVGGVVVSTSQTACPGQQITYGIQGSPLSAPSWTVIPTSAGTLASSLPGSSATVTWHANGTLKMSYPDAGGNRCKELFYTITTVSAGTLTATSPVCSGSNLTLTVNGYENASGMIWQQCTSGCTSDTNWTTAAGTVTGNTLQVNSIQTNTTYRTKVTHGLCGGGTVYSNQKVITVNPSYALGITISDPGAVCENSLAGRQIGLIEGSSIVGSNPSYQWYRGYDINTLSPAPGNESIDPKFYNPVDPTYTFQPGEIIRLKVTSNGPCDSPNIAWSNAVTITVLPPVTSSIAIQPGSVILCPGGLVTFTAQPTPSNYAISLHQWTTGSGGLPWGGPSYIKTAGTDFRAGDVINLSAAISGGCLTNYPVSTSLVASAITFVDESVGEISGVPYSRVLGQTISLPQYFGDGGIDHFEISEDGFVTTSTVTSNYVLTEVGTFKLRGVIDLYCNEVSTPPATLEVVGPDETISNLPTSLIYGQPINPVYSGDGSLIGFQFSTDGGNTWIDFTPPIAPPTGVVKIRAKVDLYELPGIYYTEPVNLQVTLPNYIAETVALKPAQANQFPVYETGNTLFTVQNFQQNIQYFDGLGRPMQTIGVQASPAKKDVVQPIVYDDLGREKIKYLPYAATETNGGYKIDAVGNAALSIPYSLSPQYEFYQAGGSIAEDEQPYAETAFEPSPANRVIKQGSPGEAWQPDQTDEYASTDRTIKFGHETNGEDEVLLWRFTYPTITYPLGMVNTGSGNSPAYYAAGKLVRTRTKDEQHHEVIEYKTKQGKIVLKRVQVKETDAHINDTDYAGTYYIYDDFGNLVCIISPEATKLLPDNFYQPGATDATKDGFLKRWAFRYAYDARGRMIRKQVPGADPVYMVYDSRDRLVLTQDGNQRSGGTQYWTFIKYDEFNRPILTGIKDTTAAFTQEEMQDAVNIFYSRYWTKLYEVYSGEVTGNVHGYTNKSYPVVQKAAAMDKDMFLTVAYYDKYDFRSLWTGSYAYVTDALTQTVNGVGYSQPGTDDENKRVVGQQTGTKRKVLDGGVSGGYTWLKSVNYYDDKNRLIQVQADNYKAGVDRVSTLYDFAGKVLMTKTAYTEGDVTWKDLVGVQQDGNKLIRTVSGSTWGSAGAASVQQLAAGTDGWIEFQTSEAAGYRMLGLSDQNTNAHYNTIDYAWYQYPDGTLSIYENGTQRANYGVGSCVPGEVLKIERTGTTVKYHKGSQLMHTSTVASSSALMVDAALYNVNATLVNLRTSFSQITKTITRRFVYDHTGRALETWHRIDAQPEVRIAYNEYNELGQLVDKKLHSTSALGANAKQSVDYTYTIRGWLETINNSDVNGIASGDNIQDYFGMELAYDGTIGTGNTGLFNGNISGVKWSVNQGYGAMKEMAYNFTYDPVNRLTTAAHFQRSSGWLAGEYDEGGLQYDLNGNINKLERKGAGGVQIDNLTYNYGLTTAAGNKLMYVQDNTTVAVDKANGFVDGNTGTAQDYSYDYNGNMTRDLNKGIGNSISDGSNLITYNLLNLPETVTKSGNSVRYIYDASGRKLSQVVTTGTIQKQTDYAGELVYENDILQFISHEEGRVVMASEKLVATDACESTATMTAENSTIAGYEHTGNGEKYIRVTSNGTARGGVFPTAGTLAVQPGQRYRIRAKGYNTGSRVVYLSVKADGADLNWPGAVLPGSSVVAESWIEQTVTIPPNATTLRVGVTWNTATNGQIFYLNEFSITQLLDGDPEYQYHLKDHLGNVRVTFTTVTETDQSLATLEVQRAAQEQSQFIYYDEAVRINSYLFDHTDQSGIAPVRQFYRGINLNGPAITIDGNNWQASATATNFSYSGDAFENQTVALEPATDVNRGTMIRSSIWGDIQADVTSVPTGIYDVYLYVWEDSYPQTYSVTVEGVERIASFNSIATGRWFKLGPFRSVVNDGTLSVSTYGGIANVSGLEIWTATGTGNQPPVVTSLLTDQSATEGQLFSYTFTSFSFTDPDANTMLTYTAALSGGAALPGWLSFNSSTRTFGGTPGAGVSGPFNIRVTASDGSGGVVSDEFALIVSAASGTPVFYRAINVNGPALTIDGHSWLAGNDANFNIISGSFFENQNIPLTPATDANRTSMIRSSVFDLATLTVSAVATGTYDVYLYVWQDDQPDIFSISVEGILAVSNYNSGSPGTWARLGPFRRYISDGNIQITNNTWVSIISGVEIEQVPGGSVAVAGISLSPSTLSLSPGQTSQVTRTIMPTNATNQTVAWTSDNNNVAYVNSDGWVSAVSVGTATITATINGYTAQTTLNVTIPPTSYSTRLSGTTNERYGLAKSLSVMPGDTITMEVFAKYIDTNSNNWNAALTNLMSAIAQGTAPAGTLIDGGAAGSIGTSAFPFTGVLPRGDETGDGPKAYLNYIVFDRNFVFKTGGFKRLTTAAKETGTDVPHERLAFDGAEQVVITEPGYVYIYLSNENDTPVEVFFDDFKVTHIKGPIVSSQEYYPFGHTFNSYQRENSVTDAYGFTSKELQDELNLGWLDYGARMYDPQLGRWHVQDPVVQFASPYVGIGNNPVNMIDPNGMTAYSDYMNATYGEGNYDYRGQSGGSWTRGQSDHEAAGSNYAYRNAMDHLSSGMNELTDVERGREDYTDENGSAAVFVDYYTVGDLVQTGNGPGDGLALAGSIAIPLGGAGAGAGLLAEAVPPIAAGLAAAYVIDAAETAAANRTFVTYTKRHPNGSVYVGRASGYGDPFTVMTNRDRNHHMNALGYGAAILDRSVSGFKGTPGMGFGTAAAAYSAIRGREQQLIDFYGGVGSPTVGNAIRGVSAYNPLGKIYYEASNIAFGQIAPYTGF